MALGPNLSSFGLREILALLGGICVAISSTAASQKHFHFLTRYWVAQ